jgi:transposase
MDVGDRTSVLAVLERDGTLTEGEVRTTRAAVRARFAGEPPTLVVLEVGPHSPWLSRLLRELGHAPLVANPSRLPYLTRSGHKTDRVDAATLAHLARANVELLHPVEHRSEQGQAELAVIRARNAAVEARTALINHIRGAVKAFGERLPACSAPAFARRAGALIPEALRPALEPLLDLVATLTAQIRGYDGTLAEVAGRHPAVRVLTAIRGVGTLTALAYVLTLEDPHRFRHSRDVGAFLGLVPRRRQSGARDPELPITKTGDRALRRLLVQCAHYILGRHGEDSNLRRWGLRYAGEGSRSRKKKAVVAVARRLAVLLHHLWVTGEVYEPLYGTDTPATSAA